MIRYSVLFVMLLVMVGGLAAWSGCAPAGPPLSPEVKLNRIEIAAYEALHKDYPTGYDASRVGFFELALIFDITNPNDYPIKLEAMRVTAIDFEGAPGKWLNNINAAVSHAYQWIPAKETNQVRLTALFTTRLAFLNLALANAVPLKELGISRDDMIKKWWTEITDFKYKIRVTGDADFSSPQGNVKSTFSDIFPK